MDTDHAAEGDEPNSEWARTSPIHDVYETERSLRGRLPGIVT